MKRLNSSKIGDIAENAVERYVKERGWKILARNWQKPWGEIDIVAKNKKKIIFIEVKALDEKFKGAFRPEEHFTRRKIEKLKRTCHSYLLENKYPQDTEYRIDLAAVDMDFDARNARVRYYKNAIAQ